MISTTKMLRAKYMLKAIDIGSNAIKLVNEFFNFGIYDEIYLPPGKSFDIKLIKWTLSDLDRALDAMGGNSQYESKFEVKAVDNRKMYTKELARCAIHDTDKHALLSERIKYLKEGGKEWCELAERRVEVANVVLLHHAEFWWDGIK